jgi:hypothetical protein
MRKSAMINDNTPSDGPYEIRNIEGSSRDSHTRNSKIEHYRNKIRPKIPSHALLTCAKYGCSNDSDTPGVYMDGAHVLRKDDDRYMYLVPLCHTHNRNKSVVYFDTKRDVELLRLYPLSSREREERRIEERGY